MRDFFTCLLEIEEITTTQTNVLAAKAACVSFQTQACLVNSYPIETVREYFVSTKCQKSLCGVISYQLSTPCSTDSVAQSLQRFTFIVPEKSMWCNILPVIDSMLN